MGRGLVVRAAAAVWAAGWAVEAAVKEAWVMVAMEEAGLEGQVGEVERAEAGVVETGWGEAEAERAAEVVPGAGWAAERAWVGDWEAAEGLAASPAVAGPRAAVCL